MYHLSMYHVQFTMYNLPCTIYHVQFTMYNLFAEAHQAKASSNVQFSFEHFFIYQLTYCLTAPANCTLFAEAHQAEASVHGKWYMILIPVSPPLSSVVRGFLPCRGKRRYRTCQDPCLRQRGRDGRRSSRHRACSPCSLPMPLRLAPVPR